MLRAAALLRASCGASADGKCALENVEIEESVIFNSNCAPADRLSVTMENQILLDITSLIDSGLITEILSQNSSVPAENFQLGAAGVGNPTEDGLLSSQDAADVGETLLDHKYSLTAENQKAVVKVHAVHLHGNNNRDDEDLEKYKELHLPEEAEHAHSPYLPSDGVPFLSSVAMQRKNCSVPTSSVFAPEGTVNQNVGTIPVRLSEVSRSFMPPVTESSGDTCGLPQTSGAVCDEIVVCQLEGGTQMLCINSCGAEELKPLHLVPEHDNQQADLQSDVDSAVTAVLGQFLPVLCEVALNKPEVENGPLQPVTSAATLPEESDLHRTVNTASEGYCDFFANGDFCNNHNCNNCYNSQLHQAERFKAMKSFSLDRNPEAFLPKIEKGKLGGINPHHHNKGRNCKHTGCLENYCECFEAKIMCSSICKCISCKNFEENGLKVLNSVDIEGNSPVLTSTLETLPTLRTDRQPAVCISLEEVKAVCTSLLMQAEEAEKRGYSGWLAEWMIMEEFGKCLCQILHAQLKSKGLKAE